MDGTFLTRAERYISETRRRQRRRKAVTVLASVVVFCTTYALILPAITMEHTCGQEAHTHTVDCYTQLLPPEDPEAICGLVEDEVHQHTADCYAPGPADPTVLTCEDTDPDHVHGPLCYGDWQLTCLIPEHVHDESCGAKAEPSETPTDPADPAAPEGDGEEETPGVLETALTEMFSLFSTNSASTAVPTADTSETTTATKVDATFTKKEINKDDPAHPSNVQVDDAGGTNTYEPDGVTVSKTLEGTDIENVFDITLTVTTPTKIEEIVKEPDMAVVIVMDISNTMTEQFKDAEGNVIDEATRYQAAMTAASDFLDKFAENNTLGVSKVGYVAFNTDAHKIFDLQSCTNETEANKLKNTMRTQTGNIINKSGYGSSHSRFTNMEAGLKMAEDMLASASNQNKFVIFLTDGFPTTYINYEYTGYDPYDTTGRFYDHVVKRNCTYGTSYSDTAAVKARERATAMKSAGTTIFSIGVNVGGQNLQALIDNEAASKNRTFSVVERKNEAYEIGGTDANAFTNWLKTSIGSGYYYDSTNTGGLKAAYSDIFQKIKTTVETNNKADWVATDPIPDMETKPTGEIEFIGLFDKGGNLKGKNDSLSGSYTEKGEDTASYNEKSKTISWDLKSSGYASEVSGNKTTYTYQMKYRVRLKNEEKNFIEYDKDNNKSIYPTNNETTLRYKVTEVQNGVTVVSQSKLIDFPIPAVHGYLGELTFKKVDQNGDPLENVKFTLSHAYDCDVCHGDKVPVPEYDNLSDKTGTVYFDKIPSGHTYTLTETVPDGYNSDGNHYTVEVAYDKVTVTITDYTQKTEVGKWTDDTPLDKKVIVNTTYYELPATGGVGTAPYTLGGLSLLALASLLSVRRRRRKGAGA